MPLCEMLSHHVLASVASRFTLSHFPICLRQTTKTHTHTRTHTLRHNLILLYCPHPHLLSHGRRRKAFMQNRPQCTNREIHRQAQSHIYSYLQTRTRTRTHTSSFSPVVSQMKTCQWLQQFYSRFHFYRCMQIPNLLEINAFPSKK